MYEELEKGNSNITNNIMNFFEDDDTINYLSWIMTYDFEITEVNKCIEDIINSYTKEALLLERNEILKELDKKDLEASKMSELESRLSEVIIKLAKIK